MVSKILFPFFSIVTFFLFDPMIQQNKKVCRTSKKRDRGRTTPGSARKEEVPSEHKYVGEKV